MKKTILLIIDLALIPFTLIGAVYFLLIRKFLIGFFNSKAKYNLRVLRFIGIFPIRNHYYEPYFLKSAERRSLKLTGIELNEDIQLELLKKLNFGKELVEISENSNDILTYSFSIGPFLSGDAEILYSVIRHFKPLRVVEVGGGHSSKIIQHALKQNNLNTPITSKHTCIEPFEAPYLKSLNITLIRKIVTEVDVSFFSDLKANDILFIDSSHILRPDGDVLYLFLEVIPNLNPGVLIHIHDIFTPNDYLTSWRNDGVNFWNEQYLLEAFLTCNEKFEVFCAVNYLKNKHYDKLKEIAPMLSLERQPGSMWLKVKS
jgi:hypothetical protein